MKFIGAASVLLFLCTGALRADAPELEAGVYLKDGGQTLEVNGTAVPFAVDWNNDGRKDLLVGQFTNGNIWLFLNQGTDINPVFNGKETVKSNGSAITTTYG